MAPKTDRMRIFDYNPGSYRLCLFGWENENRTAPLQFVRTPDVLAGHSPFIDVYKIAKSSLFEDLATAKELTIMITAGNEPRSICSTQDAFFASSDSMSRNFTISNEEDGKDCTILLECKNIRPGELLKLHLVAFLTDPLRTLRGIGMVDMHYEGQTGRPWGEVKSRLRDIIKHGGEPKDYGIFRRYSERVERVSEAIKSLSESIEKPPAVPHEHEPNQHSTPQRRSITALPTPDTTPATVCKVVIDEETTVLTTGVVDLTHEETVDLTHDDETEDEGGPPASIRVSGASPCARDESTVRTSDLVDLTGEDDDSDETTPSVRIQTLQSKLSAIIHNLAKARIRGDFAAMTTAHSSLLELISNAIEMSTQATAGVPSDEANVLETLSSNFADCHPSTSDVSFYGYNEIDARFAQYKANPKGFKVYETVVQKEKREKKEEQKRVQDEKDDAKFQRQSGRKYRKRTDGESVFTVEDLSMA